MVSDSPSEGGAQDKGLARQGRAYKNASREPDGDTIPESRGEKGDRLACHF